MRFRRSFPRRILFGGCGAITRKSWGWRFPPCPEVEPENALAAEVVRQLHTYLGDPEFAASLPLRPAGTRFQRRVWEQIAAIPGRETRTYGDLARILETGPRAGAGMRCQSLSGGCAPSPRGRGRWRAGRLCPAGRRFLLDVKRWLLAHEQGCWSFHTPIWQRSMPFAMSSGWKTDWPRRPWPLPQ